MDGDMAPIGRICDLAERYGAMTYLRRGPRRRHVRARGAGVAARDGNMHRIDVIEGRLPRPLAVSEVTSADRRISSTQSALYAPSFIFTTALPPAVCAAATAAIQHLKGVRLERERHRERAVRVKLVLGAAGFRSCQQQPHCPGHDRRRREV